MWMFFEGTLWTSRKAPWSVRFWCKAVSKGYLHFQPVVFGIRTPRHGLCGCSSGTSPKRAASKSKGGSSSDTWRYHPKWASRRRSLLRDLELASLTQRMWWPTQSSISREAFEKAQPFLIEHGWDAVGPRSGPEARCLGWGSNIPLFSLSGWRVQAGLLTHLRSTKAEWKCQRTGKSADLWQN